VIVPLLVALRDQADAWIRAARGRPLANIPPPVVARAALASWDFAEPVADAEWIGALHRWLSTYALEAAHPRHYGLFQPRVDPGGVAAEALAALHNPSLAVWGAAPMAVEVERHVLRALAARVGWTDAPHATFTTGGAEANLTAVLFALARAFPRSVEEGVAALPARPVVYRSIEAHASVVRAVQVAGLGRDACRGVGCDAGFRLSVRALRKAIADDRAAGRHPLMIVATAGSTSTGAIDPLGELADVAAAEGMWLHVDGAWGAGALLSPALRACLDGVARADSLTWDAHKWLGVAQGAGMFFSPHAALAARVFAVDAPYLPGGDHPYATTIQWSRRAAGLKVFGLLAAEGWGGLARRVERCAALGERLRGGLRARGWRLFGEGPLPVVCFASEAMRRGKASAPREAARLRREGAGWLSDTRVAGRWSALRACVANPATTEDDVDALVAAVGDGG
jgi:glutamate/tyrosine decarboxylase-like PLP-dependent enzyme